LAIAQRSDGGLIELGKWGVAAGFEPARRITLQRAAAASGRSDQDVSRESNRNGFAPRQAPDRVDREDRL